MIIVYDNVQFEMFLSLGLKEWLQYDNVQLQSQRWRRTHKAPKCTFQWQNMITKVSVFLWLVQFQREAFNERFHFWPWQNVSVFSFFFLLLFFFFYLCVISTSHFPTQNPIRKTEALATKQPQTSALLVPFASTLQSSPLLLWKGSSSNPFIKSPSFSEIIATPFSSIKGHASVTMQLGRMRFSSTELEGSSDS